MAELPADINLLDLLDQAQVACSQLTVERDRLTAECNRLAGKSQRSAAENARLVELQRGEDDGGHWYSHQTMTAVAAEWDALKAENARLEHSWRTAGEGYRRIEAENAKLLSALSWALAWLMSVSREWVDDDGIEHIVCLICGAESRSLCFGDIEHTSGCGYARARAAMAGGGE